MADTKHPAPTDAELDELRQANGGKLNFVTFSEFRTIARAVLAKWGTPAAHSGAGGVSGPLIGCASIAASAGSEPVAWLVCSVNSDGTLSLEHAAAWQEAAHEHINDAITEHGIDEAASWVVRPAYTHPSPPEGVVGGWIALPGTLPDPGKPVLLDIGEKYPIRAMWVAKHTLEVGMEDDAQFGEYDEATGTYYCPEGWYEWNEQEERHWRVDKTPVAWCELPTKTGTAQPAPQADSVTEPAAGAVAGSGEVVAHRVIRKNPSGEWESGAWDWSDGPPSKALIESIRADNGRWRIEVAYAAPTPPAQAADSVLEDAARYRWIAAHCRSTSARWGGGWSIVVEGPAPKSHDSEDDFDEAVDAARKQGANHD